MGNKMVEGISAITRSTRKVTSDIQLLQFTVVTACMVDLHVGRLWMLVDTGLENSADFIVRAAEKRYGSGARPQAILLTHGHFDHVGSLVTLTKYWDVPAYIHKDELPYILGEKSYPPPDPGVGGGMVAALSSTFPHTAVDIGHYAVALPLDGTIPGAEEWRWLHTPGHTQGHVSFFRDRDDVLIAGDALCTTKQESLLSVLFQREQISGPPAYLTEDWERARDSVKMINLLNPSLVIPSHGRPMRGHELKKHLQLLAAHFNGIAVPHSGRYMDQ